MNDWTDVRSDLLQRAEAGRVVPFVGAAISIFRPTAMPQGGGMLYSALRGVFTKPQRFVGDVTDLWPAEEQLVAKRSPEVVLQGLFEGLPERVKAYSPYDALVGGSPNPIHRALGEGLVRGVIPSVVTTNPDDCVECAAGSAGDLMPVFDAADFLPAVGRVYHLHGFCSSPSDDAAIRGKRLGSLTNTLNSMGAHLPDPKHLVLEGLARGNSLLFLGYSGSDPDVWYSLDEILATADVEQIFWCELSPKHVSGHLDLLNRKHPGKISLFFADLTATSLLRDLAAAWGLPPPDALQVGEESDSRRVCQEIQTWASKCDLTADEQAIAYGWLLVQVGDFVRGAELLDTTAARAAKVRDQMLAHLLCGFAYRELSHHEDAQRHLLTAVSAADDCGEPVRRLQALHKLAESEGSFERFQLRHLAPYAPLGSQPARKLRTLIGEYDRQERDPLSSQRLRFQALGRVSKGNAMMNLGQICRRVCAYWEGTVRIHWCGLAAERDKWLRQASLILSEDGDMRSLAMVEGAGAGESDLERPKRREQLEKGIEYAEQWNQDLIQIGSAHFNMADFLKSDDRAAAERHFRQALSSYSAAQMGAELARTYLELWLLLRRDPATATEAEDFRLKGLSAVRSSQGTLTWKILFPWMMRAVRFRRSN